MVKGKNVVYIFISKEGLDLVEPLQITVEHSSPDARASSLYF